MTFGKTLSNTLHHKVTRQERMSRLVPASLHPINLTTGAGQDLFRDFKPAVVQQLKHIAATLYFIIFIKLWNRY